METVKSFFFKPDPKEQVRKCNQIIRANGRKLDREMMTLKNAETKTKNQIIAANRRAQRDPSLANQSEKDARNLAKDLIKNRKAQARLSTSKAQLNSVGMQVQEAFAMRKIEGSMKASVGIMRDVNTLVRLPELTGTMRELSQELMKAGVIEEMTNDMMEDALEEEDEEADEQVDKVLSDILHNKARRAPAVPTTPTSAKPQAEDEEEEDAEAMLDQMRGRLEALKS